ncbi:MAG: hypothetical protein K2M48_05900, partial [Clostridiales bacterium]|nr:hypothetical protein [Clostridiales bacterium]
MKAIRTKNKIKAFAVSIVACLALILSTVFTFGYSGNSVPVSADARAAGDETGIRFVQVAAGSDFAIGLTYDGRLFGWSLDPENNRTTLNAGATSLGGYYIKTPTEIPVKFRVGPGGSAGYDWSLNTNYHNETTTVPGNNTKRERIVSIAATSTTAAFITEGGYIYTWGNDSDKDIATGYNDTSFSTTNYRYLLLRPYTSNDAPEANWCQPYIIDYNYYEYANSGLSKLAPVGTTYSDVSIAGGENNYIVVFQNVSERVYYSFVWGSLMYDTAQRYGSGYDANYNFTTDSASDSGVTANQGYNIKDGDGYRNLYRTQYVPAGATGTVALKDGGFVRAVAGGYTVGINASEVGGATESTSLTLKGKNFITSEDLAYDADTRTVTPTVAVKSSTSYTGMLSLKNVTDADGLSDIVFYSSLPKANGYTIEDAIVGGYFSTERSGGTISSSNNSTIADLYYARQAVKAGTSTMVYSVDSVE